MRIVLPNQTKSVKFFIVALVIIFVTSFCLNAGNAQVKTKKLQEIDDVLVNPYKGFATRMGYENPVYDTKMQYSRFTWKELEPEKGNIDWEYFEKDWGDVESTGKSVAFRIMCVIPPGTDYYVRLFEFGNKDGTIEERIRALLENGDGHYDIPEWLVKEGVRMIPYTIEGCGGGTALCPDYSDPKFLEAHRNFLLALGKRYDGDPRIAWIDIGSYGFWGEQHFTYGPQYFPHLETTADIKQKMLEQYYEAFPTTPKVITFDDDVGIHYVVERGGGLRNDCLGIQHKMYLDAIGELNDIAWKQGFITGEFCGNTKAFIERTTDDFDEVYEFIQTAHWSVITFKLCQSGGNIAPVNEQHRKNLDKLYKKLGYRFVLQEVTHEPEIQKGQKTTITLKVENKGVAPFYYNWPLVLSFVDAQGNVALEQTCDVDIRKWLPGTYSVTTEIDVPADVYPKTYDIKVAIVDPLKKKPGIMFANTNRDKLGRYTVGAIRIK